MAILAGTHFDQLPCAVAQGVMPIHGFCLTRLELDQLLGWIAGLVFAFSSSTSNAIRHMNFGCAAVNCPDSVLAVFLFSTSLLLPSPHESQHRPQDIIIRIMGRPQKRYPQFWESP